MLSHLHLALWQKLLLLLGSIFLVVGLIGIVVLNADDYGFQINNDVYIEVVEGRFGKLDPFSTKQGTPEHDIISLMFSGLVRYDSNHGAFLPDLAESFQISEDYKEYSFTLRQGAKWHDGADVTIDDVVYTYNLVKNRDFESSWLKSLENVSFEVDYETNTITFQLAAVDRLFMQVFSLPIVPSHILSSIDIEQIKSGFFSTLPVGTGPFKLIDIVRVKNKDMVRLEYFSDYYKDQKPLIPLLYFEFVDDIENISTQASAFRTKPNVSIENFQTYRMPLPRYQTLFFNLESSNVANINARRGVQYLIQLFTQNLEKNIYKDVFVEEKEHSEEEMFVEKHSEEEISSKVKELFYNAGWQLYSKEFSDGIRRNSDREKIQLRLLTLDTPELKEQAESIRKSLLKQGVEVIVGSFPWSELYTDFIEFGNYDILLLNVDIGYGNDHYKYLHSSYKDNFTWGRNFSRLNDVEFDILLEDVRLTQEEEQLSKVLAELEKRYDDYVPYFYIEEIPFEYYISSELQNITLPEKAYTSFDRFHNFFHFSF